MSKSNPKNSENEDLEKDIDACDHVHADDSQTDDEDLPETNLIPGLDKPERKKAVRK